MNNKFSLFAVVMAFFALGLSIHNSRTTNVTKTETVYERIMRTGTIRCGYTPYSVGFMKDPNTGKMSGIYVDVVKELAKNLQLKIEYVEEVGWGQQIEGLQSNRYDMICSPTSLNASRTRSADFSIPLYYSPVEIWVRTGDPLAQASLKTINKPEVKISVLDGEQTATFARNYFPLAQAVSLPQSASFSELMLQVTTKKADITFAEPTAVFEFMEQNPNTLEKVKADKPLVTVPNILLIPNNQFAFKEMIDNGLRELFNTGFMDQAISKYEKYPNSYIRETALR